jgi:hypothetical protein
MLSIIIDVLKSIGLLFQLLWEETQTFADPYWRALKRFFVVGTLVPLLFFIVGFLAHSTTLFIIGGIFHAWHLSCVGPDTFDCFVGKFLKSDTRPVAVTCGPFLTV